MTLCSVCIYNINHTLLVWPSPWFWLLWPVLTSGYPKSNIIYCSSLSVLVICLLAFRAFHSLPYFCPVEGSWFLPTPFVDSFAHAQKELGQWKIKRLSSNTGRRREAKVFLPFSDSGSFSHSGYQSSVVPIQGPARDSGTRALLTQLLCWILQTQGWSVEASCYCYSLKCLSFPSLVF